MLTNEDVRKMLHDGGGLIEVLQEIAEEQLAEKQAEKKERPPKNVLLYEVKRVIFNDPATIVFWRDGTRTVVKAQDGEEFDPEKGLAMCIAKYAAGNTRDYYAVFQKYCKNARKE